MPTGELNPLIVVVTVFVDVSMTETEFVPATTYAYLPLGVTATPFGFDPTLTVATTVFAAAAYADTAHIDKTVPTTTTTEA
jgi:hypothetical protein